MDIYLKCMTYSVLYIVHPVEGELSSGPFIHPDQHDEIENSSVSFRCITKDKTSQIISWTAESKENICSFNQTCGNILTQSRNGSYNCNCLNSNNDELILDLEIQNITKDDHSSMWNCEVTTTSSILTKSALLLVKGETSIEHLIQPEINDKVENSSVSFKCMLKTSAFSIISWMPENLGYTCIYNQTCDMLSLNPENGRYSCKCQNTEENGIIVELQIYNITRKDHESTWSCEVLSSSTRLKKKAFLFVKVPVETVEIMPPRKIIQISENSSYQFTCTSSIGRPVPKILWVVATENNQGYSLTFKGNQSDHNDTTESEMSHANSRFLYSPNRYVNGWKIFCSVEKTEIQTEVQSDPVQLNITYPPLIGKIVDQTVVEGDALNISCPVIPGNPDNTQIKWTTSIDIGKKWLTQFLVISNVSRKHDMEYICTVNNTMVPTFEPVEIGWDSESFHLTVEYKSAVKAFFIDGYYQQSNITVNENDNLLFRCHIESKPISTTSIHFESGEALDVSQSNDVSYNIRSVTCQQAGKYVCSGRNKHNGQDMAKQTLFISINCAPRPDSNYPVTKSITVSLTKSASLYFTAIAYPKPKNVLWQKHNGDVWIEINSTNNINLNRSDLNFSLHIKAIVQESYGIYRLIIVNKFGSFEQLFFINGVNSEHEYNPNVASYIAVGVGTFAVTVLAFILSIVAFKCIRRKRHSKSNTQESGNQRPATSEEISLDLRREEIGIESTYEQLDKSNNEIRLYTAVENISTGSSSKDYVNMNI